MISLTEKEEQVISQTQKWLEKAVIGLNLCPFAKAVHLKKQIKYVVSVARSPEKLLLDLTVELKNLQAADPEMIDTTLLIHPWVLEHFMDYNDFLERADKALHKLKLDGVLQIASFHPEYQFAGSNPNDIENHTNRSPHPMLHILREASVERAIAAFPNPEDIFVKNQETLRALGHAGWKKLI